MGYHNKMEFSVFVILALATASMMWIGRDTKTTTGSRSIPYGYDEYDDGWQ